MTNQVDARFSAWKSRTIIQKLRGSKMDITELEVDDPEVA